VIFGLFIFLLNNKNVLFEKKIISMKSLLNPIVIFFFIAFSSLKVQAKDFPVVPAIGSIDKSDFFQSSNLINKSTNALIIDEIGLANLGWDWSRNRSVITFEYYVKVLILNEDGIKEATHEIELYSSDDITESVAKIEGASYNIVDSVYISQKKLEKKDIFTSNYGRNTIVTKFTLPDVKVGSVIEIKYTKTSDYLFNFQTWYFQTDNPKLSSTFHAVYPPIYDYNVRLNGSLRLSSQNADAVRNYLEMPNFRKKMDVSHLTYQMKNIPPIKEEKYLTTLKNYQSALFYELKEIRNPYGRGYVYSKSWDDITEFLMDKSTFGDQIDKMIFKDEVKEMQANYSGVDLAKAIYDFTKSKLEFNDESRLFTREGGLKKVIDENLSANSAEVNLLLINLLKRADLEVYPVILSTRGHGFINSTFPTVSDFNYVIAKLSIDGQDYLLDGTDKYLKFGDLPMRCFNVRGRLIDEDKATWVDLEPKVARKEMNFFKVYYNDLDEMIADHKMLHSPYSSYLLREELSKVDDIHEYYLEKFPDVEIVESSLENLDDVEKPLTLNFKSIIDQADFEGNSKILINPYFIKFTENPFKLQDRTYPVEFGTPFKEIVSVEVKVPPGYTYTNNISNYRFKLPDNLGYFLQTVSLEGDAVKMQYTFNIRTGKYPSSKYQELKRFINAIIVIQGNDLIFERNNDESI
jgi:hypothetical protein